MKVPDIPYWGTDIHNVLGTKGWVGPAGPRGGLDLNNFWMSEFKNYSINIDVSYYLRGISAGGDGPVGGRGYIRTPLGNVGLSIGIYSANYVGYSHSSAWTAAGDIGVRGRNVTNDQIRSLGLNPDQIKVTGKRLRINWSGSVDHGCGIGEYRFTMARPWTGGRLTATGTEGGRGRRHYSLQTTLRAPEDNEVVIPAWIDIGGGGGAGSHGITMTMRGI